MGSSVYSCYSLEIGDELIFVRSLNSGKLRASKIAPLSKDYYLSILCPLLSLSPSGFSPLFGLVSLGLSVFSFSSPRDKFLRFHVLLQLQQAAVVFCICFSLIQEQS